MEKQTIGLVGLAVMGKNLALNIASKGFTVALYNRILDKVKQLVDGPRANPNIRGTYSIKELVDSLAPPRRILLMVKAGPPVDEMIG